MQVPFNFVSLLLPPPSQTQCLSLWFLPCLSWWSLPGLLDFLVVPPGPSWLDFLVVPPWPFLVVPPWPFMVVLLWHFPWPFGFPHGSPLDFCGCIFSWFLPGPLWWFLPGLSSRFLPGPLWWSLFGISSRFLAGSSSWSHPGSSFWPFTLHYLSMSFLYIM
ncbi:hypothetical protein BDR07DRAFT_1612932 [Suillus spraguei]|nr:hypothetical protein BDR07DRAFT_1612932 [Suillus spraguei]